MRSRSLSLSLSSPPPFSPPAPRRPEPSQSMSSCAWTRPAAWTGCSIGAKRKLWAVVNDLAKMEPTPTLRVGLYSYGNNTYDAPRLGPPGGRPHHRPRRGLQADQRPASCAAAGSEEYPARVARDALAELKWADDKDALKLVFVCGNEPVDQDKEVSLESVADDGQGARASSSTPSTAGRAITRTRPAGRRFATRCGGKYANIDQDRVKAEVVIKTPFDEEIEKLGAKINETYVWYGVKGAASRDNQLAQDRNADTGRRRGGRRAVGDQGRGAVQERRVRPDRPDARPRRTLTSRSSRKRTYRRN